MFSRVFILGVLALQCTYAQTTSISQNQNLDEVVVSDSRFPLKRSQSGKTVIKLTQLDLQKHLGKSIAEVINQLSGIEVNGSRSYAGQNLSYFIRGGNNRQVLVLIDGVPVSDPSRPTSDFDLSLVSLSQIDSVEIVKGASSTLYGSGAATAVILITTKRASQNGIHFSVESSLGTNNTQNEDLKNINDFNNTISIQGKSNNFSFLSSYSHQHTDGISAVVGDENDPFSKQNIGFFTTYAANQLFSVDASFQYDTYSSDFDDAFSLSDAANILKSKQLRYTIAPKFKLSNGSVETSIAIIESDREVISDYPNSYESSSLLLDALYKHRFSSEWLAIAGVQHASHTTEFSEEAKSSTTDPYVNMVYLSESGFHLNTGLRFNNHSEYGGHLTYSFNPSFVISNKGRYWKFLASYSSAYIAPSLSYLFGPFGANPDLKPEENQTLEGGIEFFNSKKFNASVLYFNRKEVNYIDYLANGYENVSQDFEVSGIEFTMKAQLFDNFAVTSNYTYTDKKDVSVLRIPMHKANASLDYQLNAQTAITAHYQYNSNRNDADFSVYPSSEIDLEAFQLIDFSILHRLEKPNIAFTLTASNIFDESYQEIYGFSSKGRNIKLGMLLSF